MRDRDHWPGAPLRWAATSVPGTRAQPPAAGWRAPDRARSCMQDPGSQAVTTLPPTDSGVDKTLSPERKIFYTIFHNLREGLKKCVNFRKTIPHVFLSQKV